MHYIAKKEIKSKYEANRAVKSSAGIDISIRTAKNKQNKQAKKTSKTNKQKEK